MQEPAVNSVGMELVGIGPGRFRMGSDADAAGPGETPVGEVAITEPFRIAATPVTNAQFEAFDGAHRTRRGERGFSTGDDEAAVAVSWHDAVAFCGWLAERERRPYRLPTEAEWEYACRAGTTTPYHTGATLPEPYRRHQEDDWHPTPVDLTVGETPPNDWGVHDVHGLVEEWCRDWHGPYPEGSRTDPAGPATGTARVTRGGSHNTAPRYLRSAARSGALPGTRNWLLGVRPVVGPAPGSEREGGVGATHGREPPAWGRDVGGTAAWEPPTGPTFEGPVRFVRRSAAPGVVAAHNHCPSVTWCANGDLLAVWFSTGEEHDREMRILASRYRDDRERWDRPSVFFDVPGRNLTGSSLYRDGDGTLYHVNGVGAASHWANLALVVRESDDDGASWSAPRFVESTFGYRNQAVAGAVRTGDGDVLQPCDAVPWGEGGTAVHVSADGGRTWHDPGRDRPTPRYAAGRSGGTIAGIHAGVAELADGRLLALGRGVTIDGRMPRSVSTDGGETWTYAASAFPPLSSGQRPVLRRLREGPLLYVGFTDPSDALETDDPSGMDLLAPDGERRRCYGLFAAVSVDGGESWPVRRLLSPGDGERYDGGAWTGEFRADAVHGEPRGYLAATQTPDGVVHLLSSALHYRFDAAWLLAGTDGMDVDPDAGDA